MLISFQTYTARTFAGLGIGLGGTLLHGDVVDERGKLAIEAWGPSCTRVRSKYDVDAMTISLGDATGSVDSIVE